MMNDESQGGETGPPQRSDIPHSSFIIHHSDPPAALQIVFQTYAEAYGEDFEDCRRRVPDLSKLGNLTGLTARWGLDDIIRELVEKGRGSKMMNAE
jgi:hypothetical protein